MPCYEPTSNNCFENKVFETVIVRNDSEMKSLIERNKSLLDYNNQLEAIICAIMNELQTRGIDKEVVEKASREGLINIMDFWARHRQDDYARLSKEIHKYSVQEQAVIKDILNYHK